jgi:hypothetical protein
MEFGLCFYFFAADAGSQFYEAQSVRSYIDDAQIGDDAIDYAGAGQGEIAGVEYFGLAVF